MKKLNTRVSDQERHEIETQCTNLLHRRKVLVFKPWDNSPYRYYMNLLPPDVRNSIELLDEKMDGKFKTALHKSSLASVKLRGTILDKKRITFHWKGQKPCLDSGWSGDDALSISPKHPAYAQLHKFIVDAINIEQENSKTIDLVRYTIRSCNTYGQIHRVWPDLLPTIGGEKVAAAEGQQRKSQLPAEFNADKVFMHRDEVTTILAQASLLPEVEQYRTWI